jgi:hypothetical protein
MDFQVGPSIRSILVLGRTGGPSYEAHGSILRRSELRYELPNPLARLGVRAIRGGVFFG